MSMITVSSVITVIHRQEKETRNVRMDNLELSKLVFAQPGKQSRADDATDQDANLEMEIMRVNVDNDGLVCADLSKVASVPSWWSDCKQ